MRQAGISLAALPLAQELAASPENVSCAHPLPPATQAKRFFKTFSRIDKGRSFQYKTSNNSRAE